MTPRFYDGGSWGLQEILSYFIMQDENTFQSGYFSEIEKLAYN